MKNIIECVATQIEAPGNQETEKVESLVTGFFNYDKNECHKGKLKY